MKNAAPILLAFAAAFAAPAVLGADGDRSQRTETQGQFAASEAAAANGNPLRAIPLSALSETRDRPLFSASRRPPVQAQPPAVVQPAAPFAAKPAEPELPPLSLVGTIVSEGKRVAILKSQTTGEVTQASERAEVSGWLVRAVTPRAATLEKDGQSIALELPRPGGQSEAAVPLADAAPRTHEIPHGLRRHR